MPLRVTALAPGPFMRQHLLDVGGMDYVQAIFRSYKAHLRAAGVKHLPSRKAMDIYIWICNKLGLIVFDHAEASGLWNGVTVPPEGYVRESRPQAPSPRHYYRIAKPDATQWEKLGMSYRLWKGLPKPVRKPRVKAPVEPIPPPIVEAAPAEPRKPGRPRKTPLEVPATAPPPAPAPSIDDVISNLQGIPDETKKAVTLRRLEAAIERLTPQQVDAIEGLDEVKKAMVDYTFIKKPGMTPEEFVEEKQAAWTEIEEALEALSGEEAPTLPPAPTPAPTPTRAPARRPRATPAVDIAVYEQRYTDIRDQAIALADNPTIETLDTFRERLQALLVEVNNVQARAKGPAGERLGAMGSRLADGLRDIETAIILAGGLARETLITRRRSLQRGVQTAVNVLMTNLPPLSEF